MSSSEAVMTAPRQLRSDYPGSFKAMLAICSDLDETRDAESYFEVMRFLNSTRDTSIGPGIGLEMGNTMYFDMAPGQFSYWNASEDEREKIRALMRSGHIDCIHSFGDLATTRRHAARALEELERHDCRLRAWVDHAEAPTNFGEDIMLGHGDEIGHACYHADLTIDYGIQYVWRGRVTSVLGQNKPASLRGIANPRRPLGSAATVLKEFAKQMLARAGSRKYRLHRRNRVAEPAVLRDGAPVTEFLRSNPHWAGVTGADNAHGLAEVLTSRFLDRLVSRGAATVLYTHIGKTRSIRQPLPEATVNALRRLAEYHHDGRICVTTSTRLLDWVTGSEVPGDWRPLEFPSI